MPQVRVMLWNIENFGGQHQVDRRGVNNQLLANFIRDLARGMALDAFGIMEVMRHGQPALQAVLNTLNAGIPDGNADWRYDWIKSSVAKNAPFPPTAPGHTSWNGGGARYEGSAFFWRSNQAATKFRIVPALRNCSEGAPGGGHYLDMVTQGLDFNYIDSRNWGTLGGYNPSTHPTQQFDDHVNVKAWSQLDFPWVSVTVYDFPRPFKSRRPVFAVMELTNGLGTNDRLMPIVFYHAPSNKQRAEMGTFLAACSQQVNVTHDLLAAPPNDQDPNTLVRARKAIIGGDFNRAEYDPLNQGVYTKFTFQYLNTLTGGSNMNVANIFGEPTTVQIRDRQFGAFTGPPVTTNRNEDYTALPIDNLFYRNLTTVSTAVTGRYNVLAELRRSTNILGPSLVAYRTHLQQLITASGMAPDREHGPLTAAGVPVFGLDFTDWASFWADLKRPGLPRRPYFTTARSAAEFYHMFISDHFPIMIAFQW
jgi:hypothetical protein